MKHSDYLNNSELSYYSDKIIQIILVTMSLIIIISSATAVIKSRHINNSKLSYNNKLSQSNNINKILDICS